MKFVYAITNKINPLIRDIYSNKGINYTSKGQFTPTIYLP
jgi:hypothetical protein